MEIENCNPVAGGEATSEIVVVGLLVDCKDEASVSSAEAGLEGFFGGEEVGERKVTIGLGGKSELEGVRGWKSSSGLERNEKQSSQGGKLSGVRPSKPIKTNLNRGNWSQGLVNWSRTLDGVEVLFLVLASSLISFISSSLHKLFLCSSTVASVGAR